MSEAATSSIADLRKVLEQELARHEVALAEAEAQLEERRAEIARLRNAIAAFDGDCEPSTTKPRRRAASKAERVEELRQSIASGEKLTRSVVAQRYGVSLGYASVLLADARRSE